MKCKGKIFIGFWICEGGGINVDERGLFANRGGWDECPSLGHLAGHGREREREIFVVEIFVVEVIGRLEKKLEIVKVGRKLRAVSYTHLTLPTKRIV